MSLIRLDATAAVRRGSGVTVMLQHSFLREHTRAQSVIFVCAHDFCTHLYARAVPTRLPRRIRACAKVPASCKRRPKVRTLPDDGTTASKALKIYAATAVVASHPLLGRTDGRLSAPATRTKVLGESEAPYCIARRHRAVRAGSTSRSSACPQMSPSAAAPGRPAADEDPDPVVAAEGVVASQASSAAQPAAPAWDDVDEEDDEDEGLDSNSVVTGPDGHAVSEPFRKVAQLAAALHAVHATGEWLCKSRCDLNACMHAYTMLSTRLVLWMCRKVCSMHVLLVQYRPGGWPHKLHRAAAPTLQTFKNSPHGQVVVTGNPMCRGQVSFMQSESWYVAPV